MTIGPRSDGEVFSDFLASTVDEARREWAAEMASEGVGDEEFQQHKGLVNPLQVVNHVCTRAIAAGLIDAADTVKPNKTQARDQGRAFKSVAELYARSPGRVRATVAEYLRQKRRELRLQLSMFDADDDDPM
jgi:hypothetical protein